MAAAPPYILVAGNDRAPPALDEDDTISQTLFWIGFVTDADRHSIILASLESYEDIRMLSEKDVQAMAEDYHRRPVGDRITFGIRRTKLLKALTHWIQKIFNIYETEGEPMAEDAKIRFLFKNVQHPGLQTAIAALRVQMNLGTVVTYTMAANHLSTTVSELPEHIAKNRNVSGVSTDPDKKGSPDIYNNDGYIITGHIHNWRKLTQHDRDIVMNERKRRRTTGGKGGKGGKGNGNGNNTDANHLKQLSANNKLFKRQIKALKRRLKGDDGSTATTVTTNNSDDEDLDAGDQMGGRKSKKRKDDK